MMCYLSSFDKGKLDLVSATVIWWLDQGPSKVALGLVGLAGIGWHTHLCSLSCLFKVPVGHLQGEECIRKMNLHLGNPSL